MRSILTRQPPAIDIERGWPRRAAWACAVGMILANQNALAQEPPRYEVLPGANHSFEMRVDGVPRASWHFLPTVPRPFLFPLLGPSGQSVTRMGHPGAPDHDHHRSVWFAHYDVEGFDFWSENGGTRIEQSQWYTLQDHPQHATVAFQLRWLTPDQEVLLLQDCILQLSSRGDGESLLEIQTTLTPPENRSTTELRKTNFGLLAVRVSKSISQAFGRGQLTSDQQEQGEPRLFGRPHRWVDYSGASAVGPPTDRRWFDEGITYFDHPSNPGFPSSWHVRQDGWMCASPTMNQSITVTSESPLRLRYLLHVHAGAYDANVAQPVFDAFAASPAMKLQRSSQPHLRYEVIRESESQGTESGEN